MARAVVTAEPLLEQGFDAFGVLKKVGDGFLREGDTTAYTDEDLHFPCRYVVLRSDAKASPDAFPEASGFDLEFVTVWGRFREVWTDGHLKLVD